MLLGVRVVMSLVERRGVVDGLVVGILSWSSSGSTMGIENVVGFVPGFLSFFLTSGVNSVWADSNYALATVSRGFRSCIFYIKL